MTAIENVGTTPVSSPSAEPSVEGKTGRLRGSDVTVVSTKELQPLRLSNHLSSADLNLRVMLAMLDMLYALHEVQKTQEREQEKTKDEHWGFVKQTTDEMRKHSTKQILLPVLGCLALAAGTGLGYHIQSWPDDHRHKMTMSGVAGLLNATGQVPDKVLEFFKQGREANVNLFREQTQRAEKKSQAPAGKISKSERIEDNAYAFCKQYMQQLSQLHDAMNSMGKN